MLKRAVNIWNFKNNPYINRIGLFGFFLHTDVSHFFLNINENCNDCHQQGTTYTFLYIQKAKKTRNVFTHKTLTLSKKQHNFCYVFINNNRCTLIYPIFKEIIEVVISIQKALHFAIYGFYYTKGYTLCKNQDNLRYIFKFKTPDTMRSVFFM